MTGCPALIEFADALAVAPLGAVQVEAMEIVAEFEFVLPQVFTSWAQKDVVVVIGGLVIDAPVPTEWLVSPTNPWYHVTVTGLALVNETESVAVPPDVTCWFCGCAVITGVQATVTVTGPLLAGGAHWPVT